MLLLIAGFIYNNTKYFSINYSTFKLNYCYQFYISFEKDISSYFKSQLADKLTNKLKDSITMY